MRVLTVATVDDPGTADAVHQGMRSVLLLPILGLVACVKSDDPCGAEPVEATDQWTLSQTGTTQAYLTTPAAAKDCHAVFTATIGYTGADAFDVTLPRPKIDVSANAVGTGGEQPGLIGIFTDWTPAEDPGTGSLYWWADISAGAKNVDATAVNYGMAAVLNSAETRPVAYHASILYQPPPEEPVERLAGPCLLAR